MSKNINVIDTKGCEFGYEIIMVLPYVYYLHKQNVPLKVLTSRGMKSFYFFLKEDEYEEKYQKRTWVEPHLLNVPLNDRKVNQINSIDEAAENLSIYGVKLSPEVEFHGHCSNLQAWAENHYDTRLLHSNLSFPLLKKLAELGDPQAKQMIKDEIFTDLLKCRGVYNNTL